MKRKVAFLMVLAMILSLCATPVFAETENQPLEMNLYAGKNIPVGTVEVWNNADTLFVKYSITEPGWEMTESHLSVGLDLNSIPKTDTGNPIPGQFKWSRTYDHAVTTDIFEMDADGINDGVLNNLEIAAHAAVQHKTEADITPSINWTRSSEDDVYSTPGYGGDWTYADVMNDYFDTATMDGIVWDSGSYEGSERASYPYASWKYAYNNGGEYNNYSDLRLFRAEFSIQDGFEVAGATLGTPGNPDRIPINDNVYVYVNEELLFWGGTRLLGSEASQDITHEGTIVGVPTIGYNSGEQLETDGWYIPGTFPEITGLHVGNNVIEVFTEENQNWGGMGKLELNLSGMQIDKDDSAWAATEPGVNRINGAPKGNWGTYFNYVWTALPQ